MKTLTFWALADQGFDTARTLEGLVRDCCLESGDVEVRVEVKPYGALWEALFWALKNPKDYPRPDLVQLPCTWAPTFAHMGLLDDLGALLPTLSLDAWLPELRGYCGLPGRREIFSLPWWMGVRVLYYRADVFEKAGLDAEKSLGTWDGFLEACRVLEGVRGRDAAFQVLANPNPRESISLLDLAPLVWVFGGQLFSSDGRRALFHREEAYRGASAYVDLLARHLMPLSARGGLLGRSLFEGHAAMQFSGRYPRDILLNGAGRGGKAGPRVRAVPFPAGPARSQSIVASRQLAVVRGSACSKEAAACARRLASPPAAAAYARAVGGLPCTASALADWFRGREDLGAVFGRTRLTARPLPIVSALGVTERVIGRAMEVVVETILRRAFKPETLREQLIYAATEVDYILSLYE